MDAKEFIRKEIESGKTQSEVARKVGVCNATIYKMLYTNTKLNLETIKKIAAAYDRPVSFFVQEDGPVWNLEPKLNEREQRLLRLFRNLDERRQDRMIDTIEDMVLALKESYGREGPAKGSTAQNCG